MIESLHLLDQQAEKRKQVCKEFLGDITPDAIVVFGGGIVRRTRSGEEYYSTTAYKEAQGQARGGKARVHAAAQVAKAYPDIPVVTLSHVDPEAPPHCEVYAEEIVRGGVERERIITDPLPYNTFAEVVRTIDLAQHYDWKDVAVVSSDYHGERIMTMRKYVVEMWEEAYALPFPTKEFVRQGLPRLTFIPAETFLPKISHHYGHVIERWKKTPEYKAIEQSEAKGVQDILNGNYRLTTREEAVLLGKK